MDISQLGLAVVNYPVFIANWHRQRMRQEAERIAARMRAKVRKRSGRLAASIRVEEKVGIRGRTNALLSRDLQAGFVIRAGGPLTTVPIKNSRQRGAAGTTGITGHVFESRDMLTGDPLSAPGGRAIAYDYAIAEEYGTRRQRPRSFFRSTIREEIPAFADVMRAETEAAIRNLNLYGGQV